MTSKKTYERPELLPVYYFYLKNAYISNHKENLDFYTKSLSKALKSATKEDIEKYLCKKHRDDIIKITKAIKDGVMFYDFASLDIVSPSKNMFEPDESLWFDDEKELEKKLAYKFFHDLNSILGTNMTLIGCQYKTDYGPIDILAQEGRTIHIIELKRDTANHMIIGQVIKYAVHFQKRLIYNLWDDVNIITITGNYDEFTYNELKKLNVTTMTYQNVEGKLNLKLI